MLDELKKRKCNTGVAYKLVWSRLASDLDALRFGPKRSSAPPKNERVAAEMPQPVFLCPSFGSDAGDGLLHELVELDDRQQHSQHNQHDDQAHRDDEQRLQNGG